MTAKLLVREVGQREFAEEWRVIPDSCGFYEASDLGNFRSLPRVVISKNGVSRRVRGGLLKPRANPNGYLIVAICGRKFLAHRLVCAAFHGSCPGRAYQCLHWNDVRDDNRSANLRWGTIPQNRADARRNGGLRLGERHHKSKLTDVNVREARERRANGESAVSIGRDFGVASSTIRRATDAQSWRHIPQDETHFEAITAIGTPIRTFGARALAMSWWENCRHDFPGCRLEEVTTEVLVTRKCVRRAEELVAAKQRVWKLEDVAS